MRFLRILTAAVCSTVVIAAAACGDSGASTQPVQTTPKPTAANAISAALTFTCALTDVGDSYCWGWNNSGQLGTGDTVSSPAPRATTGGLRFVQITTGDQFACGVTTTNQGYCWGAGTKGQLGNGSLTSSLVPTPVAGGMQFQSISAGYRSACGIQVTSHAAYCWGDNTYGSLGVGDTLPRLTPTLVAGGLKFNMLRVGLLHACGIVDGGASPVYCWGWNSSHQAGLGAPTTTAPAPVTLTGAGTVIAVDAGGQMSCALFATGSAQCWGQNSYGELGAGSTAKATVSTPVPLVGGVAFAGITTSKGNDIYDGSCGWTSTGASYCWGIDSAGQLGSASDGLSICNGANSQPFPCAGAPHSIAGGAQFVALSNGGEHVCGITTAHTVMCWGYNKFGQVGNGTTTNTLTPSTVLGNLTTP